MQTELKVNDEVIVDIKRLGINGEGIAYYKKLAIFVKNALPGEGVNVRITNIKKNMAFAEVIDFKHTAAFRVTPKCPYYEACGGCQTLHIDYQKMLEFKRDGVIEAITRYTKLNPRSFEIKPTIGANNQWGYRFKSALPLKVVKAKTTVGLIAPNSNVIVGIDSCLNQNDIVNNLNKKICELIDECHISVYDPKQNKGILKSLVVRVSHFNKEAQVTFVVTDKKANLRELAKKTMELEHVVSVFMSYNEEDSALIFGQTKKLEGKDTITETIGKYKFELGPDTFFQLNPVQTEKLYDVVKKAAKLSMKETVLDLYCGVGTIGIYLSGLAKRIIGIEQNEISIENAKTNVVINKVRNAEFKAGKVLELLPQTLREEAVDVLVCDPPRLGLGEYVAKTIAGSGIKRIIYVSCNPATLAKDLAILSNNYQVNSIQPVDMFPNTSSTETVALLTLNPSVKK